MALAYYFLLGDAPEVQSTLISTFGESLDVAEQGETDPRIVEREQ